MDRITINKDAESYGALLGISEDRTTEIHDTINFIVDGQPEFSGLEYVSAIANVAKTPEEALYVGIIAGRTIQRVQGEAQELYRERLKVLGISSIEEVMIKD